MDRLRQIAVWGEWIASHALSYFFLTLPDTLSTGRGVFDLMQEHPDIARDAFALRRAGDRIVEIVGKRPVHPVALGVGRFSILPTAADLAEIRRIVSEVKELSGQLIGRLAQRFEREARFPFPVGHHVNLFAYDGRPGQGRFKIIDRSGQVTAESDRDTLSEHVSEMRVDGSLAKFPYLTELAFPHGTLLVGPLSRLYLGGGVLDDPELENFELTRWLRDPATLFLDHLDECRLLEIFWAAKQILNGLDEVDLAQMETNGADLDASGRGIGVVEAPRGAVVHNYLVTQGTMERMRLLVAAQFNNAYINLVLRDLAERHVEADGLSEAGEQIIAQCVRMFDPCLTCATH